MSAPDEEIRSAVDDENGASGVGEKEKEKRKGGGFVANFRKAKKVVRRGLLGEKTDRRRGGASSSTAAASGGGGCLGRGGLGGCFVGAGNGESSFRSNTSDPNDPNFTYGMLKSMIEKNDFYSRECNTHLEFKRE